MPPLELHIYDVDGTLYRSPTPAIPDPIWWYHAHSFGEPGSTGYDKRWVLDVVYAARRSIRDPTVAAVVITGRPEHARMRAMIEGMMDKADLAFDAVVLQPIFHVGSMASYKASAVEQLLEQLPTVRRVVFYDDLQSNLKAVGRVVEQRGIRYDAHLGPGM